MEQRTDRAPADHPRWCVHGPICRVDGIHHGRPVPATTAAAAVPMRLWLEQTWRPADGAPMLVLEVTESGEARYLYLPTGQGRVLAYQVRRLIDLSKGGRR